MCLSFAASSRTGTPVYHIMTAACRKDQKGRCGCTCGRGPWERTSGSQNHPSLPSLLDPLRLASMCNILHVPHPSFPHIITPCTGILGWACCRGRGVVAAAARKQQRGHTTMLGRRAMGGAFLLLVVVLLTAVQVRADSADLYAVQCAKVKEAKCVIEDMRGGRAWNGSLALALLGEISHR